MKDPDRTSCPRNCQKTSQSPLLNRVSISPIYYNIIIIKSSDVFQLFIKKLLQSLLLSRMNEPYLKKKWKTSAVSTTVWMVETQLCKLRGTCNTNNPSRSRTPGCQVSGLLTNIKHRITSLDMNINTSTRTVTCWVLLRIPLTCQVQRRNSTYCDLAGSLIGSL